MWNHVLCYCQSLCPFWPPDVKNWLTGKDPDAGKDWRWEEKGRTEDEMVGWHHWLNGHEFEQDPGVGDGQGPQGCKESDTTEWVNWTESLRVLGAIHSLYFSTRNLNIASSFCRKQCKGDRGRVSKDCCSAIFKNYVPFVTLLLTPKLVWSLHLIPLELALNGFTKSFRLSQQ